jgi:hypothetical protein
MANINFQIDELDQLSVLEPNNEATIDRCVICYEDIDSKPTYELPECSHKFHQSCINAWFRQGNAKCPLCNNIGSGLTTERYRGSLWSDWPIKFKYLRRFSKKKGAPLSIVRAIDKLKKKEQTLKQLEEEYKDIKKKKILIDDEEMTVKDLINNMEKRNSSLRRRRWGIRRCKRDIVLKNNIVPLIIVEKKGV